jgi:hypothetical protein
MSMHLKNLKGRFGCSRHLSLCALSTRVCAMLGCSYVQAAADPHLNGLQVKSELLNVPDRPMSLFEGLAGAICFWADLLGPELSHFPGFDLPTAPLHS